VVGFARFAELDMSPSAPGPRVLGFDIFELDVRAGELRKQGVKVRLQGQPLQVLETLLTRTGEVVTREELRAQIWKADTFVDFDHSLHNAIARLREVLGDSAENPRYIETLPRRGYRFLVPVESHDGPRTAGTPAQVPVAIASDIARRAYGRRVAALALASAVTVLLIGALSVTGVRQRLLRHSHPHNIESLAVLPLVNLSDDSEQDFFADGMTEALITDLGKISALRVISRTSVVQYKGTKKPLPEIARELNVDGLVEGTVLRSGNHLRITVNLLQASPEKHLWAESYEGEIGDILALQGQVAQAVAREVQVKLTPEEQKLLGNTRPVNPQAHDDYLKGRYLCERETREGLDKAIPYFQKAIEEAPSDPLAYVGLADCYTVWGWAGDIFAGDPSPTEIMPKARDAAQKALQLDENFAEAHTTLACVEVILNWNWSGAEREFKRAIELNPSSAKAHVWYAHYLAAMGRFDESAAEAQRALQLDPISLFTMDFEQWALYMTRHYDLLIEETRKSLELAPEFAWAHYERAMVFLRMGRGTESLQEFLEAEKQLGLREDRLKELKQAYQQTGYPGYWRKTLAFSLEASKQPRKFAVTSGYGSWDYMDTVDVGAVQVRVGDFHGAFETLNKAFTKHDAALIYLNVDPTWDPIRSDPRFQILLRRIRLKG
jgi:TolB-like protein/DNA-binding winged helix-turn-helix (wHTH) protein